MLAEYAKSSRTVEGVMLEAVLGEETGPVDSETLRQAVEALTDAVDPEPR